MVMAGPAPGRPMVDDGVACRASAGRAPWHAAATSTFELCPAAAVPVSVKMPEPMTMPMPRTPGSTGPSVFLQAPGDGSSEDAISSSMLLVRKRARQC